MTKIKSLELVGFRGAKYPLQLDLTSKARSVAVFGDNGCGKSSLTDALEWFFTDRVEHLWRDDCKSHALRNVGLLEKDDSTVCIDFQDGPPLSKKILTSKLASRFQPTSVALTEYLAIAENERLILRNQELTSFVSMRKGDKRKYVADIIGYDDVIRFRDSIQQTLNAIKNTPDYVAAKKTIDQHRAELLKHAGEIVTTDTKFYGVINSLLMPFALELPSHNAEGIEDCRNTLKGRIKQQEKAERKQKLRLLSEKLDELKTELSSLVTKREAFVPGYQALIKDINALQALHLADFLEKGKAVLDNGTGIDGRCPFCLTEKDIPELAASLTARIESLAAAQASHNTVKIAMNHFVRTLTEVARLCTETHLASDETPCTEEFTGHLSKLAGLATTRAEILPSTCASYKELSDDQVFNEIEDKIANAIDDQKQAVKEAESKEVLTHEEESIVEVLTKLSSLTDHFTGHQNDSHTITAFETQIRSLQRIFDEFIKMQTSAMQNALNVMSEDIAKFYNGMHPNENADEVHLSILGDEGVEFRYKFHGEQVHPPMKYLSESHLNSLGIALFLASVKLFNQKSRFFVLDDVVSSFDIGHRRRLLRLLKGEFADWQIILLTHEPVWFELIRREMRPDGWILNEVIWDDANGTLLEVSASSFRELIQKKIDRGEDIENDLRKLLELVLKEHCESLEVKVAFRSNEFNEKRMPGELLSALKGTLNKKCSSLKGHSLFSKLEGSAFIANIGSHHNTEALSAEDLEVVLEDIDELDGLFRCPDCNVVISVETYTVATNTVTCKCGKLSHPWKD
jgi:recombinational DNA repair ATPase RecF